MSAPEVDSDLKEQFEERTFYQELMAKGDLAWERNQTFYSQCSKQEQEAFYAFDRRSFAEQEQALASENGPLVLTAILKILQSHMNADQLEYLIYVLERLLADDPRRARFFHKLLPSASSQGMDPFAPFFGLLSLMSLQLKPWTIRRVLIILGVLLRDAPAHEFTQNAITTFIVNQNARFSKVAPAADAPSLRDSLSWLSAVSDIVSMNAFAQQRFVDTRGVKILLDLMAGRFDGGRGDNSQLLYQCGLVLWILSYNASLIPALCEADVPKRLVTSLKKTVVEKCNRILIALAKNLVNSAHGDTICQQFIGMELLPHLDTIQQRKVKDQDLAKDLDDLLNTLNSKISEMSTFDVWMAELSSGDLHWSPAHTMDKFWRENINELEKQHPQILRRLLQLLSDASPVCREVAAHDCGEFARFLPEGKLLVTRQGIKQKLMELMSDPVPAVAKSALVSLQKIMVQNWEILQSSSKQGVASLSGQKK